MFRYYEVNNRKELDYAHEDILRVLKRQPETVLRLYFFTTNISDELKTKARDHANVHGYTVDVMERKYDPMTYPEDALIFGGPMEASSSNVNNLERL